MNYPDYYYKDLELLIDDLEHETSQFAFFVNELLNRDIIEDSNERSVLIFVKSKGTSVMSLRQGRVLSQIVDRYNKKECRECGDTIPFDEVLDLEHNHGLCLYHKNRSEGSI